MRGVSRISVIVPVLDEGSTLEALLDHLASLEPQPEVVVADGGSRDGSAELARAHRSGPHVLETARGRAVQMNAGACAACGEVLVFLHADTRLGGQAWASLTAALDEKEPAGGNFELAFDGRDRFSRALAAWRRLERRAGVYYGDSAIFCRRPVFERLGGFAEIPIMEDYDFARRLERSYRTACLAGPVVTSARRWQRRGVLGTFVTWSLIRWLWLAGVPARRLAPLYGTAR